MISERSDRQPGDVRRRAFVLDDDRLTRQLIAAHVERLGFVPVEVRPEPAAVSEVVAVAGEDDVLVVDVILGPSLDGFEVIRMLGHGGFRGRLIVVSGFGEDYLQTLRSLATALSIRVAGSLVKPIRPADLARSLNAEGPRPP